MPSKKGGPRPRWLVILEDIRSQNRSTIEAVEASGLAIHERIDRFEQKTESRFTVVETAIQSTNRTVDRIERGLASTNATVESIEKGLAATNLTVERIEKGFASTNATVESIERRLFALEAALQRIDQESRSRDTSLELAVRDLKLSVQQNGVDIRDLAGKVEALSRLEERVSALERRGA